MTTVEGGSIAGGTTPVNAASSSYGGGGVCGKFRKKPFRGRQSTPYDRPSTVIRPSRNNNVNSGSWLTKLVLDPATKLISYGADRFFSSILRRKQLPPPSADVEDDVNDGVKDIVSNNQIREQEPARGQHNPPIDVPSSGSISELEQLLKQKTFTRPQIIHLTELLRSRAKELPSRGDDAKETTEIKLASDSFEENRTNGLRSAAVSTPILKSKVLDDSIASPAELAKSYMESMPSKVSPSSLVMRSQTVREVSGLLGNTPSASKSSNLSLSKKMFGGLDAPENGFITPRSRSRSAIYNMAHTPYSRVYSASTRKGSGVVGNGYAGSLLKPASPYLVEHEEKFERPTSLKRRNTALDDEVGSIGPIRRIRQKPNLLAPRIYHASHGNSDVKQKGQLTGETMHDIEGAIKANENQSGPSTSYARVPSKSSEVAARIFQQLEKLSPDKKSSQSKIVATREKSHLELKQSMFSGQARSSVENDESMKMLFDFKDGHELPDSPELGVTDAIGSSSKNQENEVKNVTRGSVTYSDALISGTNNAAVSLKASGPSFIADTVHAPQHLSKKNAFTMSAEKEKTELVKLNGPTEEKPASYKISETGGPGTTTEVVTSSESFMLPPSASASGKLKEANNPPPLFSFSSTGDDKFLSLPSKSNEEKRESKQDDSNRLLNVPASISALEMPSKSDKADHFKFVTARNDTAKSENMHPVQSNGPQFAKPLFESFSAASSSDTNQALVGSGFSLKSSASGESFVPSITSTAASSSASVFGSASSTSGTVFKFGTPVDQTTAVSAAQLTNVSENLERKVDGSSSASLSTFTTSVPTSSGSGTPALFSSFSNSAAGNIQSSFFSNATKSPVLSSIGTSSQGASGFSTDDTGKAIVEKGPSTSVLTFGMSSSASSDATKVSSSSNSAPAPFSFSSNPSASSTTIVGTSSVATPSVFGFGGNSSVSSSLANTAGALISGTSGIFNIGTSFAPSSAFDSTLASTSPSSGFSFAASSTASSASSTIPTSSQSIGFSIGASSTSSAYPNTFTSSSSTGLSFGASSTAIAHPNTSTSSSSTGLSFGASSTPIAYPNTFTSSSSTGLSFGASSTPITPNTVTSSPFTGFSFGASSSTPVASTNISPTLFTSSTRTASSNSMFPLATTSASTSFPQPLFGGSSVSGFGASQGNNNDQMNGEDTMAEDPVQAAPPSFPVFGQTSASTGFPFGSTAPSQGNPFVFGEQQQNQATQQNPSPFQGSGSVQFNAGGGFSLGSGGGGGDKSNRKIVKVNRLRNRKK